MAGERRAPALNVQAPCTQTEVELMPIVFPTRPDAFQAVNKLAVPIVFPTRLDAYQAHSKLGWMQPSPLVTLDEVGTAAWLYALAPAQTLVFGAIRRCDAIRVEGGYKAAALLQVWSPWTAECPVFAMLDAGAWRLASTTAPKGGATYVRIDASITEGFFSMVPYRNLLSQPRQFEEFKRDFNSGAFIRP